MIQTYIFLDTDKDPRAPAGAVIYLTKAYTSDEAWRNFARYAKDHLAGFENATAAHMRSLLQGSIVLIEPGDYIELLPRYPSGVPVRVGPTEQ